MKIAPGYEMVDGKIQIIKEEAEIIRFWFDKIKEYSENPPDQVVAWVLETAEAEGKTITREEAIEKAKTSHMIDYYIAEEAREKFAVYYRKCQDERKSAMTFTAQINAVNEYAKKAGYHIVREGAIVTPQEYEQVQAKLKKK